MPGPQLAEELKAALCRRHMEKGFQLLADAEGEIGTINVHTPGGASFLLLMAQWVDVGYRDYRFIEALLERFPMACRGKLPTEEYLCMRMAEAFRDLAAGDLDGAVNKLDLAIRIYRELPNLTHEVLAHFWKGRAHRKKGEYEIALEHIRQAREMAQANRDEIFTAVIQIQESWLLFQKGLSKEALQILERAESVLRSTDHYVALANIESARGRIVRRTGEYSKALEHYARAVSAPSGSHTVQVPVRIPDERSNGTVPIRRGQIETVKKRFGPRRCQFERRALVVSASIDCCAVEISLRVPNHPSKRYTRISAVRIEAVKNLFAS